MTHKLGGYNFIKLAVCSPTSISGITDTLDVAWYKYEIVARLASCAHLKVCNLVMYMQSRHS